MHVGALLGANGGSVNANRESVLKVLPRVPKSRTKTPARAAKKKAPAKKAPVKAKTKSSAAAKKKSSPRKAAPKKASSSTRASAKVTNNSRAKTATAKKTSAKKKTTSKAATTADVALVSVDKRDDPKLKKLIELGKERGFLTANELSQGLPKQLASPDEIDGVMSMLGSMDIEVVENTEAEAGVEFDEEKDETSEWTEEAEPASESPSPAAKRQTKAASTASSSSTTDTSDPVRMYLQEMGGVPLLSREEEVTIAKQIESGENEIKETIFSIPLAL